MGKRIKSKLGCIGLHNRDDLLLLQTREEGRAAEGAMQGAMGGDRRRRRPGPENQPWVPTRPDCDNDFMPISLFDHVVKHHHPNIGSLIAKPEMIDPSMELLKEMATPVERKDEDFDMTVSEGVAFAKR